MRDETATTTKKKKEKNSPYAVARDKISISLPKLIWFDTLNQQQFQKHHSIEKLPFFLSRRIVSGKAGIMHPSPPRSLFLHTRRMLMWCAITLSLP